MRGGGEFSDGLPGLKEGPIQVKLMLQSSQGRGQRGSG